MPAAKPSAAPLLSRKPTVRPVSKNGHTGNEFDVTFPWGGRARIYAVSRRDESTGWSAQLVDDAGEAVKYISMPSYHGDGLAATPEKAFMAAGVEAFAGTTVPAWGSAADVHKLARECDGDRALFVKTIKRIAKERFGVTTLSVRGSTGTAWGWVSVSPKVRYEPTLAEGIVISQIDGRRSDDASIRPCGGARVAVICRLAGHPLPDGFEVQAPQWD
jgi:hypothetical protein